MIRKASLAVGLLLLPAGCGTSAPPSDMPARTWQYYFANSAEIEPMQKICRQWSGSTAPAGALPAIVAANCSAAAYAKARQKLKN